MGLMGMALTREVPKLHEAGVRVYLVGDRDSLKSKLRDGLTQAEELTRDNERLILNVCFNYGGRWDMSRQQHACMNRVCRLPKTTCLLPWP